MRTRVTPCWLGLLTVLTVIAAPFTGRAVTVTNLAELELLNLKEAPANCELHLEGVVWLSNPSKGRLVLKDNSGVGELEVVLANEFPSAGQRVCLEGFGTLSRNGGAIRLGGKGPVVDNDGVHGMIERSGSVYLSQGLHSLCVDWFNGVEKYGLKVECAGPERPRASLQDGELFRTNSSGQCLPGLNYRCYEVAGETLPNYEELQPIKAGIVSNFDLGMIPREEHIGIRFEGFFDAPHAGFYTFLITSDDGSRLFAGEPTIKATVLGDGALPEPRRLALGQPLRKGESGQWAEVEGRVTFVRVEPEAMQMELRVGAGRLRAEVAGTGFDANRWLNARVRAVGFCEPASTSDGQTVPGALMVQGTNALTLIESAAELPAPNTNTNSGTMPLLTLAREVHQLKREDAERGYPVKIRGVVTCVLPEHYAFTLEDATRGLYVEDVSSNRPGPPQLGEYLEVKGTTDSGKFAPLVNANEVIRLGLGYLPEPIRPTWDQLLNGSLDAQYVEIEGIMTSVTPGGITTLRTGGGTIQAELRVTNLKPEELKTYQNALVKIRGCFLASWDYLTHQVHVGQIRIYDAEITVEQPAPEDLFSSPRKTAAELLLFDPRASVFQRVTVSGQVVHVREPEYFLMDGTHGLRFITKSGGELHLGDKVEVAGFPELSGSASPILREAVARKIGRGDLPEPKKLGADELIRGDHDATRVRVEGLLAEMRATREELVLELQSGVRTFVARLEPVQNSVPTLPIGTRLELTGVYAGLGGNRAAGQDIASFELLLNSAADIRVLARPPWWTLERLFVIVGALVSVLAVTVLWLTQLHRKVDERTAQLEVQIRERQRVEQQRAMEQERARIAQDLHDELGSGMTEISMLAARAKAATLPVEKRTSYVQQMGDRAREMVAALDEIVWAMNPGHDTLGSLVSYFSLYAERFLGLANIEWRLEEPSGPPGYTLNSRQRHQLFLAFKEALTNAVRHSGATEVGMAVRVAAGELRLSVSDNGRGLPQGTPTAAMDGLANMRARLTQIGGRCEIVSRPNQGTTVDFFVPQSETL